MASRLPKADTDGIRTFSASNAAEIYAKRNDTIEEAALVVSTERAGEDLRYGWHFNAQACREAAEFFVALAEHLDGNEVPASNTPNPVEPPAPVRRRLEVD